MADYSTFYHTPIPANQVVSTYERQFFQLLRIVSDGDLICKSNRDKLVADGYVEKVDGFNIITAKGLRFLIAQGHVRP